MHQDDSQESWKGEERRGIDGVTLRLMAEMRAMMEKHEKMENEKFEALKDDLDEHRLDSHRRHQEVTSRIDQMSQSTLSVINEIKQIAKESHELFKKAIPNEDAEGHRRAHEEQIQKAKDDREFLLDLKKKLALLVIGGVFTWAGLALWAAFLKGPVAH